MGIILILTPLILIATSTLAWVRARRIESKRLMRKWNNDLTEKESRFEKASRDFWQRIAIYSLVAAGFVFWLRVAIH